MIPSSADIRAALDLGTVSSRLLIARVTAHTLEPLREQTIITHMGEGLVQSGRVNEGAIKRLLAAIASFKKTLSELQEELIAAGEQCSSIPLHAVATSAMRDATNSDEIIGLLAEQGIAVEVIEGTREAVLSFQGTLSGFPFGATPENNPGLSQKTRTVMSIDVGGGSTEIIVGEQSEDPTCSQSLQISTAVSFNIGSRRVTELFLHDDPTTKAEFEAVSSWIEEETRSFFLSLAVVPDVVFAVAGVATTIVSVLKKMEVYDPRRVHGTTVTVDELDELMTSLMNLSLEQRCAVMGLQPERAPVIVGGCMVFSCLLHIIGVDSFTVSETDILEGILLSEAFCEN